MLSLRQIRRRIKSVENTKKITHAMEMVAAAKLKRLQGLLADSDRYGDEIRRILTHLLLSGNQTHPLLAKREEIKRTLTFIITSDTGLCGSYNTNMVTRANAYLEETRGKSVNFVALGKNGAHFLRRTHQSVTKQLAIPRPQAIDEMVAEVSKMATESFIQGEADEVVFLYTKVISLSHLRPQVARLLPIAGPEQTGANAEKETTDYIIEPSASDILDVLVPEFIESEVSKYVKHSLVAEQASRMMAMRQATDNAKEMIDSLTLMRNKARQASITKELIEVVSGSRALQSK